MSENNIIYLSFITETSDSLAGQAFFNESEECIGNFEFYLKDEYLIAALNIYPEYQGKGFGYYVFSYCFKKLDEGYKIRCFLSSWSTDLEYSHLPSDQSINFNVFWRKMEESEDTDVALWSTPTGKWLRRMKFKSVQAVKVSLDEVKAIYYR
ncbi:hypothetical protein PV783_32955 [Chitinophaga sp. CC14]|uniref:hypothetical protein n=1 Tax=Chitinophaga sp. CC14 TaxID=3029199 RepID=UPI003B805589